MSFRRLLVLAALILWTSSCGIGPQDQAETIDVTIGDRPLPIESDADPDSIVEFTSSIYLVSEDEQLVPVTRAIAAPIGADAQLRAVIGALIDGPTDDEVDAGLRSAIPATTEVLAVTLDDGTVTVDLSESFTSIGGPTELRAVGQLVLTGTTFPGARALALELDGAPTSIPLPDGALTDGAVTLRQFTPLLGPASAPEGSNADETDAPG